MEDPEAINVGRILSAHGLSGEVRVEVLSVVPHRFDAGEVLHIGTTSYRISSSRRIRSNQIIITLQGLRTRDAAQALTGSWITVPESSAPELPEGEYFHFQLLGLRVFTEAGEELGLLSEILETGSNDVYVVSGPEGQILVPALSEVVQEIKLSEKIMVVRLPDGLR